MEGFIIWMGFIMLFCILGGIANTLTNDIANTLTKIYKKIDDVKPTMTTQQIVEMIIMNEDAKQSWLAKQKLKGEMK